MSAFAITPSSRLVALVTLLMLNCPAFASIAEVGWSDGLETSETSTLSICLTVGIIGWLCNFEQKETVEEHAPLFAGIVKWIGRMGVCVTLLAFFGSHIGLFFDKSLGFNLISTWGIGQGALAIYIEGFSAGRRRAEFERQWGKSKMGSYQSPNRTPHSETPHPKSANTVAWMPEGLKIDPELIAVKIEPGTVSRQQWIEAIAKGVTELVFKEPNPSEALRIACKALQLPIETEPHRAGAAIVLNNRYFQAYLDDAIGNSDVFPLRVTATNRVAFSALEETNFSSWIALAAGLAKKPDLG